MSESNYQQVEHKGPYSYSLFSYGYKIRNWNNDYLGAYETAALLNEQAERLADDYNLLSHRAERIKQLQDQLAAANKEIERLRGVLQKKYPGEWLTIEPAKQKGG